MVVQRCRTDQKSASLAKFTPGLVTTLRTWNTLHRLEAVQQVGACPFLVTVENLFQAAQLVSASSMQLHQCRISFQLFYFESLLCSAASFCWRGILSFYCLLWKKGGILNLVISGTAWTNFELFTFLIKEFPSRMRCFSLGGNCQTTLHIPMIIHFRDQRMNEQSKFSLAVISCIPNEWFSRSSI